MNSSSAPRRFDFAPAVVLDLGAGTGRVTRANCKRRYPRAARRRAGSRPGDAARGAPPPAPVAALRARVRRCAAAAAGQDGSVDLVFSNLMLQWCEPLDAAFAEVRRVLQPEGFFAFSTFGPDTLQRAAQRLGARRWLQPRESTSSTCTTSATRWCAPVSPSRCWTSSATRCSYPDALALMRDLKAIGAHNVTAGRPRSLAGRARLARMSAAYEQARAAKARCRPPTKSSTAPPGARAGRARRAASAALKRASPPARSGAGVRA